jgi:hypothetical protein
MKTKAKKASKKGIKAVANIGAKKTKREAAKGYNPQTGQRPAGSLERRNV